MPRRLLSLPIVWLLGLAVVVATQVMLGGFANRAAMQADVGLHDTYYVVAHFHYVLSLGAAFAIFAGVYFWFEKMCGVKYNAFLGATHFWIMFVGASLIIFPQFLLNLQGMQGRYVDYPEAFALWNQVSSMGYAMTLTGVGVFLLVLVEAAIRRRRRKA